MRAVSTTIFKVFGMTRQGIEPATSRTHCGRSTTTPARRYYLGLNNAICSFVCLVFYGVTWVHVSYRYYLSRPTRKPKLWTLRKVSTRICQSMSRRLTRTDNFCFLWIFRFRNQYCWPLFPWDGMYRPGLAYAGWSRSILYAETIMLVLSWNDSLVHLSW